MFFKRKPRIDDAIYGRLMTSFGRVVDHDRFVAEPAGALAQRVIAEHPRLAADIDARMYRGAAEYHLRLLAGSWMMSSDGTVPRATAEAFEEAVAWKFGPLVKGSGELAQRLSALARGEFERDMRRPT
jgi:hypothetical protein